MTLPVNPGPEPLNPIPPFPRPKKPDHDEPVDPIPDDEEDGDDASLLRIIWGWLGFRVLM